MGFLDLFSSRKVNEFAKSLAAEVAKRYPPAMAEGSEKRMSAKGVSNVLESVFKKAEEFAKENKLGFYKKAKMGNTFRWELKSLGYSDKFIELATEGLIVFVTRGSQSETPPSESGKNT